MKCLHIVVQSLVVCQPFKHNILWYFFIFDTTYSMSNIALCQTKAAPKIAKIHPKLPHLRLPEHAKQTTSPRFCDDARSTCATFPLLNVCKTNAAEQCPPRVKFCFYCVAVFFVFCVVAPQGLQAVLTWLLPLDGRIPAKLFGQRRATAAVVCT